MSLLAFGEVSCVRGGRLLFEDVSFALGQGEAALVTGPNGAGKSSMIRVAAGLLKASSGIVTAAAAALADDAPALDERLTLARALGFWTRLDGSDLNSGMEAMSLMPLAGIPVRMLSTGQRKRASLARVAASGAPLWLLDEPANGLDAEGMERLAAAMAKHRAKGGAILAASHQPLPLPDAKPVRIG